MKPIYGWWFSASKILPHNDGRRIAVGKTHTVKGPLVMCDTGLHFSRRALDALSHAPGPIVWRVEGQGEIIEGNNKLCCSKRTYLAGGIDVSDILCKFARLCALDVINNWDAPDIVVRYLRTGNESIHSAAYHAAYHAVCSVSRSAADSAAYHAVCSAAHSVARSAADSVEDSAAYHAARSAADSSAKSKQNARLTRMLLAAIRETRK